MKLPLLSLLLLFATPTLAQVLTVAGNLLDEKNLPVKAAEIKITNKDSIKLNTFTDNPGRFLVSIAPGFYYITVSTHGYDVHTDSFKVGKSPLDLGAMPLTPTSHLLNEVKIVEKVLAVVQKDDTVELTHLFSRGDDEQQQAISNRVIELLHRQNSVDNTLQDKIQQKPANEILIRTQNNIDN